MQLFHIIREQFPYGKMRGLKVRDGAVVSFEAVQYTFIFGRGMEAPQGLLPGRFDEQWQRFMRFCRSPAERDGGRGPFHGRETHPGLAGASWDGPDTAGIRIGAQGR